MMNSDFSLLRAAGLALAAMLAFAGCRHKPTPEELMERFISEKEANSGRKIYRDTVQGKPLALLQDSCKVYRLEATSEGVTEHEVLRPGFVLWFTGCIDQRVWRDGEYIFAELNNRQIGAGGGNASGGTYRSKNAMEWEKQTQKGWLPVAEAQ
jgi:hypothetical protein